MKVTQTRKVVLGLADRVRPRSYWDVREDMMRAYVADTLKLCDGDKKKTARMLNVSHSLIKEKSR